MARVNDPNYQNMKGKLGNVIYYTVNGTTYARSKGHYSKRVLSEAQQLSVLRFKKLMTFIKPLREVLKIGFQEYAKGYFTAISKARSVNLKQVFSGGLKDLQLHPERMLISMGQVLGPLNPSVAWLEDETVRFAWEDNSFQPNARKGDNCLVVLYDMEHGVVHYLLDDNFRRDGYQDISVSSTGQLHAYLAFYKRAGGNRCQFSDSVYVGVV